MTLNQTDPKTRVETVRIRPVLKWAGGKTQLLPQLMASMPSTYEKYLEPFIGGGALFFNLAAENSVIGDNTIIAAGAVVSGTFPSDVIIGGIPAKVIRNI